MLRLPVLIVSSVSLTALMAGPVLAQDISGAPAAAQPKQDEQAQAQPTAAKSESTDKGAIVITGSRVRHKNFETASPIDIITRDDRVLAGTRSTTETLQNSTITSGTQQVSSGFLGFVSDNGSAANTVGLRGLGASRTLVLLNGRRLAPAGVGPQLIAADLNVLPTSMVQRIEVLREGASSIYGSDAIAGVINIITDTAINGITLDAYVDHPLAGSADTLRGSITLGKTFDRGHITASFEARKFDGLRAGDRNAYRCPRDLFFQNGQEVGQLDPSTGQLRCFPFQYDFLGIASGYGIAVDFNAGAVNRITFPGYTTGQPFIGAPVVVNNNNLRPSPSPVQLETHLISPIKTFTGYLNGSYEVGVLGDAELYGEALFTRRLSHQDYATQLSFDLTALPGDVQVYGGHLYGLPIGDFGVGVSPFYPTAWDAANVNRFTPFIVPDRTSSEKEKVDFFRANGGLKGNIGIGDWRYDGNVQVSRTRATDTVINPTTSRLGNALVAVPAPAGTPAGVITTGLPGQTGAGLGYTCASNVTNGAYNGGDCVPLDFYDPQVVLFGRLPANVYNYIYQANVSHTHFDQETAQLVFDGTLFALPGGDANAAVGVEHRHDHIRDVPSEAALNGELYGRSSSGITQGSDTVNEAFGEINLPILKDRTFASILELDGSARYTNYKSYGGGFTYHINGQWAPHSIIRFRGNYGTSFRAPNLYEQFVANQTGFYSPQFDPCDGLGTDVTPGTNRYNNCIAALTGLVPDPLAFVANNGITVTTRGGRDNLKAEKSTAWGLGAVISVPRRIADLTIAVDYWDIKIKGEVKVLGNILFDLCYDSADFPNNVYCSFIGPRTPATDANPGNLTTLDNPYINIASQSASGLDFDVRYARSTPMGRFVAQLNATRNLHQRYQPFAQIANADFNGTLGYPGNGAGPKWVGSLDLRLITPRDITLRWGIKYIGRQDSNSLVNGFTINGQPVDYDLVAEAYWEHTASVQWSWRNIGQFTIGMRNVFNAKPPTISGFPDVNGQYPRFGNYFGSGDYDYLGRSVFVNVTRTF